MITKEEAYKKAKEYLDKSNTQYITIDSDSIKLEENEVVSYGKNEGNKLNIFSVCFGQLWGMEERSMFVDINADTGEILYIMTPHGYIDIKE
ncbi:hypothetical protein JET18_11375 [Chryseobacterium sp. L7]|uniref:PepSY domain-containing protein n=1 Tax=Chryseobacterium endalhagicum TaxID=2797638 RepID=A0ABS1QFS5_9FLAO|nr:hypothetical protein [Chryseobacterium endalhagicum]MBL1221445.1 hypothetical protein [Chryseobacterium endalhagicum]